MQPKKRVGKQLRGARGVPSWSSSDVWLQSEQAASGRAQKIPNLSAAPGHCCVEDSCTRVPLINHNPLLCVCVRARRFKTLQLRNRKAALTVGVWINSNIWQFTLYSRAHRGTMSNNRRQYQRVRNSLEVAGTAAAASAEESGPVGVPPLPWLECVGVPRLVGRMASLVALVGFVVLIWPCASQDLKTLPCALLLVFVLLHYAPVASPSS